MDRKVWGSQSQWKRAINSLGSSSPSVPFLVAGISGVLWNKCQNNSQVPLWMRSCSVFLLIIHIPWAKLQELIERVDSKEIQIHGIHSFIANRSSELLQVGVTKSRTEKWFHVQGNSQVEEHRMEGNAGGYLRRGRGYCLLNGLKCRSKGKSEVVSSARGFCSLSLIVF